MGMRALWTLAAIAVAGCGTTALEILSPGADGGAVLTPDGGAIAPTEAGLTAPDAGTRAAYCSGTGSPIVVSASDAGGASACVGGLAQSAFRWAICTCDGLVSSVSITTDSFNATQGAYDAGAAHAGGGVGTNGDLSTQGTLGVGGPLWVSDATGMTVDTAVTHGDLHVAGRIASGPSLAVGGDAYVLGDVVATGDLSVAGTLYQPAGDTASAGGTQSVDATVTSSFTVPPACDCDPALLVDVAAYVEAYRATNDDSAVGIDPTALANVTTDTTLAIPCGRIFFTRIGGTGAITLTLSPGRTAIFIGGDLSSNGPFAIDAPAGSEIDLFVEGGVVAGSTFTLGSAANPAKARLWVGGTATVDLPNASVLAGNVYAPLADVVLGASATTVYGSVFAHRMAVQGPLTVHFDESVLSSGASCSEATGPCSSCHDCANQACIAGACGACTTSSDCCAPLVCSAGTCVSSIH